MLSPCEPPSGWHPEVRGFLGPLGASLKLSCSPGPRRWWIWCWRGPRGCSLGQCLLVTSLPRAVSCVLMGLPGLVLGSWLQTLPPTHFCPGHSLPPSPMGVVHTASGRGWVSSLGCGLEAPLPVGLPASQPQLLAESTDLSVTGQGNPRWRPCHPPGPSGGMWSVRVVREHRPPGAGAFC